jgi:hypothetical protein
LISVTFSKTLTFSKKTAQVGAYLNKNEHFSKVSALQVPKTPGNDGNPIWKKTPYTS